VIGSQKQNRAKDCHGPRPLFGASQGYISVKVAWLPQKLLRTRKKIFGSLMTRLDMAESLCPGPSAIQERYLAELRERISYRFGLELTQASHHRQVRSYLGRSRTRRMLVLRISKQLSFDLPTDVAQVDKQSVAIFVPE
jgi:hypothetical protein